MSPAATAPGSESRGRPRRRPRPADDAGLELLALGEHRGVALRPGAETEVLPDRDLLGAELLDQDLSKNPSARELRELLVEGDHDQLLDAEPLDHVTLHLEGHDQLRQRRGVQDLERVRLEGEHRVRSLDHRLVAAVDAVEGPDRDGRGRGSASGSDVT